MTYEARLFKGLNRSSTLRLVPGWWDQEKATLHQQTGQSERRVQREFEQHSTSLK